MSETNLKEYNCIFCDKNCGKKSDLFGHYLFHIGERPFNCDECGAAFRRSSDLKHHIPTHIKGLSKPFKCDSCNMLYTRKSHLMRHVCPRNDQVWYQKRGKLEQCNICEKFIKGTQALRRHIRSHTGETPYPCDVCNKQFRRRGTLKVHQQTHVPNPVKPFSCDVCGASFVRKDVLKSHMTVHAEKVRLYQCEDCGKMCSQLTDLRTHRKAVHLLVKDHECQLCGKRFCLMRQLTCHMRVHTKETPFKCEKCLKSFAHRSSLKTHKCSSTVPNV